jgi:hypothetical protein
MKSTLPAVFAVVVSVVTSAPARADVPPPDVEPCTGKQAGDPCTYGTAGTCQDSTCTSPSPPPSGSTYACLRCAPDTATSTQTSTGTADPTATATNTLTGTDTSTSGDGGWCSVGKGSTAGRIATWLLASAFSLLFLWGRRHQRKRG